MVFKQNTRREFIKQNPRNDKTRFSCFHDAKVQHRKGGALGFGGMSFYKSQITKLTECSPLGRL